MNEHRIKPTSLWLIVIFLTVNLSHITAAQAAPPSGSESYLYDELGRLIQTIRPDGALIRYTYDEVGNILAITTGNSADIGPPRVDAIDPPPSGLEGSGRLQSVD